jgi:hypothetical protein
VRASSLRPRDESAGRMTSCVARAIPSPCPHPGTDRCASSGMSHTRSGCVAHHWAMSAHGAVQRAERPSRRGPGKAGQVTLTTGTPIAFMSASTRSSSCWTHGVATVPAHDGPVIRVASASGFVSPKMIASGCHAAASATYVGHLSHE